MSKDRQAGYQVTYVPSTFVPQELDRIFGQLKAENFLKDVKQPQLAGRLAYYYGELDAIHPFQTSTAEHFAALHRTLQRASATR